MRVRIKGLVDKTRFHATVQVVAGYLEDLGIEEIQGINFYLTPIHPESKEEALIVDSTTNEEINMIIIDNPTKKKNRKKLSKIKSVDNK